jgi:hypothetical protein
MLFLGEAGVWGLEDIRKPRSDGLTSKQGRIHRSYMLVSIPYRLPWHPGRVGTAPNSVVLSSNLRIARQVASWLATGNSQIAVDRDNIAGFEVEQQGAIRPTPQHSVVTPLNRTFQPFKRPCQSLGFGLLRHVNVMIIVKRLRRNTPTLWPIGHGVRGVHLTVGFELGRKSGW